MYVYKRFIKLKLLQIQMYVIFFSDYTSSRSFTEVAASFARTLGMEQCGHMAICDAHARYRDYGIIALPLILLFPG